MYAETEKTFIALAIVHSYHKYFSPLALEWFVQGHYNLTDQPPYERRCLREYENFKLNGFMAQPMNPSLDIHIAESASALHELRHILKPKLGVSFSLSKSWLGSYLCTCNNVYALRQRAVVLLLFFGSNVCLSVGVERWECVAVTAAVQYSTLNSNLKWAEEVHTKKKEEESATKIWLMYQGQGFNAISQGNSGQQESHTLRRQRVVTATIKTLKLFKKSILGDNNYF